MQIDYDKITVVEMQGLSEFLNIHCDGDKQAVVIDGVVE